MPQFSRREYFGLFRIDVYPNKNDKYRSKLYRLRYNRLPYFMGADIIFTIYFKPINKDRQLINPKSSAHYKWELISEKKIDKHPISTGEGEFKHPNKENAKDIVLGHFSNIDNYSLELELEYNGKKQTQNVADFEITSRSSFELRELWFLIGFISSLIGAGLGALVTYLVSK